jgi:hypothetical protein
MARLTGFLGDTQRMSSSFSIPNTDSNYLMRIPHELETRLSQILRKLGLELGTLDKGTAILTAPTLRRTTVSSISSRGIADDTSRY